jgi:hypothetical protein
VRGCTDGLSVTSSAAAATHTLTHKRLSNQKRMRLPRPLHTRLRKPNQSSQRGQGASLHPGRLTLHQVRVEPSPGAIQPAASWQPARLSVSGETYDLQCTWHAKTHGTLAHGRYVCGSLNNAWSSVELSIEKVVFPGGSPPGRAVALRNSLSTVSTKSTEVA